MHLPAPEWSKKTRSQFARACWAVLRLNVATFLSFVQWFRSNTCCPSCNSSFLGSVLFQNDSAMPKPNRRSEDGQDLVRVVVPIRGVPTQAPSVVAMLGPWSETALLRECSRTSPFVWILSSSTELTGPCACDFTELARFCAYLRDATVVHACLISFWHTVLPIYSDKTLNEKTKKKLPIYSDKILSEQV